jgi:hypothetical protein
MQLWNQITTLQQCDGSQMRLFDDCGEFILPSRAKRIQPEVRNRYRAIGRLISYCILHKQLIANHVLVSASQVL